MCNGMSYAPATQRNKYVIITSKPRFDVIITCLLRCVFAGTLPECHGRSRRHSHVVSWRSAIGTRERLPWSDKLWKSDQWLTKRYFNSSPPGQKDHHFADDVFRCIFVNENICIWIQISLKFVPERPFDNKSALVQIMAWCRKGDKSLSELVLTQFTDAYMWHQGETS